MSLAPISLADAKDERGEFAERFEMERTARLRRRIFWYLGALGLLFCIRPVISIIRMTGPALGDRAREYLAGDVLAHCLRFLCLGGAYWYAVKKPRTRTELTAVSVRLVAALCAISVVATPFLDERHFPQLSESAASLLRWCLAVAEFLVLHFTASALLTFTARESLLVLAPIVTIFTIGVISDQRMGWPATILLVILLGLAGAPGFFFSIWRYKGFRDVVLTRTLVEKYGEVSEELERAKQLHESLFPSQVARGPIRLHYRYEPMSRIGGDFLFAHFPVGDLEPRSMTVVLLDVTGHGVSAALAVNRMQVELSRVFAEPGGASPAAALEALNLYIHGTLAPLGVFATAICLRIHAGVDAGSDFLEWANAGHPPAFLRRKDGGIEELQAGATMLGILPPEEFRLGAAKMQFRIGDVLLAYTDGASEARSETAELGIAGLREMFKAGAAREESGIGAVAAHVMSEVAHFRSGPTRDDVLIVEIARAE